MELCNKCIAALQHFRLDFTVAGRIYASRRGHYQPPGHITSNPVV